MVNGPVLLQIFQLAPYAAGTAVAILLGVKAWNSIPALMAQWLEFRKAKALEKAADWTRLRDERDFYQQKLTDCHESREHWMERAIIAESKLQGAGEVRQAEQRAVSELRMEALERKGKRDE